MGVWIAIFEDKPNTQHLFDENKAAHLVYLAAHKSYVKFAAGLCKNQGDPSYGGMWIIEADSRNAAAKICENDPFFTSGRRNGYRLAAAHIAPGFEDAI
ncbi:YciI family protein [Maritalea sp.]|uniref:YciI family protein n=1 Tax=Maritalea sp. TaxID=2003361 RepID=UPI003EF2EB9A